MERNTEDARSRRIIFLTHCYLNQNAKVQGIANFPGVITPVIERLMAHGIGIIQMPCPEMSYIGAQRWSHIRDQYDSPMFRRHCAKIAESVLDQAEEYRRAGYQVLGFLMMDGSPVCGLKKTHRSATEEKWGGMVWNLPQSAYVSGRGVYCEILQMEAEKRGLGDIPFVSVPDPVLPESHDAAVAQIELLLG